MEFIIFCVLDSEENTLWISPRENKQLAAYKF